ncbi:uncharacterized protein A4U43_C01F30250 [Asparagus officinalis]|uniref:Uncharacterized protein n=1 Tax=Asparagus officinalis TaxID=4686 RepID=A0A5P1FU84_ASPOF|nr:uncharacterized protein A4U43_C01F30250 [Asparagus officinalis]
MSSHHGRVEHDATPGLSARRHVGGIGRSPGRAQGPRHVGRANVGTVEPAPCRSAHRSVAGRARRAAASGRRRSGRHGSAPPAPSGLTGPRRTSGRTVERTFRRRTVADALTARRARRSLRRATSATGRADRVRSAPA